MDVQFNYVLFKDGDYVDELQDSESCFTSENKEENKNINKYIKEQLPEEQCRIF